MKKGLWKSRVKVAKLKKKNIGGKAAQTRERALHCCRHPSARRLLMNKPAAHLKPLKILELMEQSCCRTELLKLLDG